MASPCQCMKCRTCEHYELQARITQAGADSRVLLADGEIDLRDALEMLNDAAI